VVSNKTRSAALNGIARKYSFGSPIRTPRKSPCMPARYAGTGAKAEVESISSCPAITSSKLAASLTVLANGPMWSRELAKATSP
jgi:hypothetical protein